MSVPRRRPACEPGCDGAGCRLAAHPLPAARLQDGSHTPWHRHPKRLCTGPRAGCTRRLRSQERRSCAVPCGHIHAPTNCSVRAWRAGSTPCAHATQCAAQPHLPQISRADTCARRAQGGAPRAGARASRGQLPSEDSEVPGSATRSARAAGRARRRAMMAAAARWQCARRTATLHRCVGGKRTRFPPPPPALAEQPSEILVFAIPVGNGFVEHLGAGEQQRPRGGEQEWR